MKKILSILLLLIYFSSFSQIASKDEIKTVAVNFYNMLTKSNKITNDIKKTKESYYNNVLTHITVVFNNNDWVIVSANKQADPILAYSYEHNYSDFVSPSAKYWLNIYDFYVYNITNKGVNNNTNIDYTELWNDLINNKLSKYNTEKATIKVAPLLSTKWGQSTSNTGNDPYAYNYYTPPDGNNCTHTLAGCPAVAIGQVMKYWQYPNCDIFDWAKMPNTLDVSNSNYIEQKKEISNLFKNISDNINDYIYGCSVSGAGGLNSNNDILYAVKNIFSFTYSHMIVEFQNYNRNEWKDLLCTELNAGRPILYLSVNAKQEGHIYVCDGWEKPLFGKRFHFNMGWRGKDDGFYKFDDIPQGYNWGVSAIINIYPTSNCNSTRTIYQGFKYSQISYFQQEYFYNPVAGNIYSSPKPIVIDDGDVVRYKAYNEIILENFETEDGADFIAEIIPCPVNCNNFTNYKNLPDKNYIANTNYLSSKNNNIKVYPNPSAGIYTILYDKEINTGSIQVYNFLGKLILEKNIENKKSTLNLTNKPEGVYLIKIYLDNTIFKQKIIKQ